MVGTQDDAGAAATNARKLQSLRALAARETPKAAPQVVVGRSAVRRALGGGVSVGRAVRAPGGGMLVSYREADSEVLRLAVLEGSPPAAKHSVATGLACEPGDTCIARFVAWELGTSTITVLLVTLAGEGSRGQGHFRTVQSELWTLTADGFGGTTKLESASSSETAHGKTSEEVALHWVDSDGEPPPEILLVRHEHSPGTLMGTEMLPGWDRRKYEFMRFDSTSKSYVKVDPLPEARDAILEKLGRGPSFAEF